MIDASNTLSLESVRIDNYRAVEHAIIPLHPQLTVLVGDNATGKTTILEAIATGLWPIAQVLFASPAWHQRYRI